MNTRALHNTTSPNNTHPNTPLVFGSSLALLATALLLTAPLHAQDTVSASARSDIERLRESTRIQVGSGVVTGDIEFAADNFNLKADIGQLPSLSVGLQAWPEDYAGFEFLYQTGLLGTLNVPQLEVQSGEAELTLVSHRFEGGFLYRWFTGPRPDSMALGVRIGYVLHNLTTSDHSPSVALSTTWFGPTLGPFVNIAALDGDIGLQLRTDLIAPFFVRESPQRSGTPRDALGYHVGIAPYIRLATQWFLVVQADLHSYSADFEEIGNRWYGDIENGSKTNTFISGQLTIEWLL